MADGTAERGGAPIDYDLHGLAGVRLVDARPRDAAAVDRQLGPIRGPLAGDPDIVVRFVDHLATRGRERLLGVGDAGFTDDAFLVLRAKFKARARVAVSFERIGNGIEFVCERGVPAVPYLIPVLNLVVLAKGALPLHAAAFEHRGIGALVTGWSKGGKTESLLAFASRGARYVGDEWVYLPAAGDRVFGIPEPIRLWDWHLAQLPAFRRRVGRTALVRLAALGWLAAGGRAMRAGLPDHTAPARLLDRSLPLLDAQRHVDIPPAALFGDAPGMRSGPFDRLFFVVSTLDPAIHVEEMDPLEAARRMVHSLQYERLDFMAIYERFRFAFPSARSPIIDEAEDRQRDLLLGLFAGRRAYRVEHPYPVSLDQLYRAMEPCLD